MNFLLCRREFQAPNRHLRGGALGGQEPIQIGGKILDMGAGSDYNTRFAGSGECGSEYIK
jgi:hypothetical protein